MSMIELCVIVLLLYIGIGLERVAKQISRVQSEMCTARWERAHRPITWVARIERLERRVKRRLGPLPELDDDDELETGGGLPK